MGHIPVKLDHNTLSFIHENKVHCSYCGKEIKADVEWDDYEEVSWFHCDCPDALKEIELCKEIRKKKNELDFLDSKLRELQRNGKYKVVTRKTIEKVD